MKSFGEYILEWDKCISYRWTIVGLTEQYLYEKIDRDKYIGHVHDLQPHVLRLNRRNDEESTSINSIKISFENELRLILYRHWTIYDSLCHSSYVSCRFKIWLTKGQKKFLEFLADMGLPLAQCKQNYTAMDVKIRENLKDWIIESSRRYGMDDIIYSSFVLQMGYKHQYSAADMVWCITAFLEYDCGDFLKALDVLTKGNLELVNEGLALAKQQVSVSIATNWCYRSVANGYCQSSAYVH
jgi:cell division control protein 45